MSVQPSKSLLLALSLLAGCGAKTPISPGTDPSDPHATPTATPAEIQRELSRVLVDDQRPETLTAFKSTGDLAKYLDRLQKKNNRHRSEQKSAEGSPPPASAPEPVAEESAASDKDDAGGDGESITNTQEAGVDEGGIVKAHGDHLVVLRRGRLFTVKVGDRALRPVSSIDVSPAKGHDAWYDEMLISKNTIVVVGFSYQVGATELGLFSIDGNGRLSRRDTFFLRSNDYYSSRNYASRLLGNKLVFYMPFHLGWGGFDPDNPMLPGVAGWDARRNQADDWDLVMDGSEVFRPVQETDNPVMHTVVTCDLGKQRFSCSAQGILGPSGRSFYVSSKAVYVWTHDGWAGQDNSDAERPPAAVYRLPLDGGPMGALRVWGAPVDQFSFKESSDGHLNVLVRADSKGDAMWSPEFAGGDIAMMRVPVQAFMGGVRTVSTNAFVDLPEPSATNSYAFQNRFVGDYLLYGMGSGWGHAADETQGAVFAYPFANGRGNAKQVALPHGTDRIEALGNDAVVVGSDGRNLHFTALDLGARPSVAGAYVQRNASQGELRSHGFFYKPSGRDEGVLGLPIRKAQEPGYAHLVHGSAEILFLDVNRLNFRELGTLASDPNSGMDDNCEVSCVDWYGNARPIFYQGRVFALLGYELVEGRLDRRSIREVDRANLLDALRIRGNRGGDPVWKSQG